MKFLVILVVIAVCGTYAKPGILDALTDTVSDTLSGKFLRIYFT